MERAGDLAAYALLCTCVYMCFVQANGRAGEQQKGRCACNSWEWGEVLELVVF
jgi:hypothetical protein